MGLKNYFYLLLFVCGIILLLPMNVFANIGEYDIPIESSEQSNESDSKLLEEETGETYEEAFLDKELESSSLEELEEETIEPQIQENDSVEFHDEDSTALVEEEKEVEVESLESYEEATLDSIEQEIAPLEELEITEQELAPKITPNVIQVQSTDDFADGILERNERHESLKTYKRQLNAIRFGGITVSDYFGDYTEKKVREFQKNYGLQVNGKLDETTIAKLEEVYNSPFQINRTHSEISDLKRKLNRMGFGGITISNKFGNFTAKRVKEFQRFASLKPNGIADTYTRAKLDKLYTNGYKSGDSFRKIADIKKKLNTIGFGGIVVSNNYRDYTAKKVREFQKYYGLNPTGHANGETIAKIDDVYKNSYRKGVSHIKLKQIKRDMNRLGFKGITVTKNFGSYMEKQVKKFQSYYGLKSTGVIEEKTLDKLNELKTSPYQTGKRHNGTIRLKKNLNNLGFGGITVSNLYGSYTEKQVIKFQRHYGLRVNGIADPVTLAKIDTILNSPLQRGKSSNELKPIKEKLNDIGYGGIQVTSYFGEFMEKRVKQYQKDKGLPVSGIIDEVTRKSIKNESTLRLFIDPGHGGSDPGASGYGLREKDVVLDIALSMANHLAKNYIGISINLSRKTDKFLELEDRAKLANDWNANYFVSLHTNASGVNAYGFETFIHSGKVSNTTKAKQRIVHDYLVDQIGIRDRGKKSANFSVLRNTNMPSLLIEYMFIDNLGGNNLLKKADYRNWLGKKTAEAVAIAYNLKRR